MEITYTRKGNYLYPNLAFGPEDEVDVRKYGCMRRSYLLERHRSLFMGMFVEGALPRHLLEINESAEAQVA